MILSDTLVPPLQLFSQSQSLGTHHLFKSPASSPIIYLSTGTMQWRPAKFTKLIKKFEERSPLSAVRSNFFRNWDQPWRRELTSTSSVYTTSGIFEKGNCCHAITSEAGNVSARAITGVTGEDSGFTLSIHAKSMPDRVFTLTMCQVRVIYSFSCSFYSMTSRSIPASTCIGYSPLHRGSRLLRKQACIVSSFFFNANTIICMYPTRRAIFSIFLTRPS